MPAERARPARSRGGELESFPFKTEDQALMRELLVTHAKRQPRERERHHQPVQRGAAHCRPRERDLRITGGELERLPLLNLKAEPRHAKNRYQCSTSSTTRPREARVAKSGILPAERARLAQEKKKKRPAWPAGAVQSATCGALCAANHRKDHNSDLIFSVSDASETVLWCRCRQCGVAASPPHGDKQLPAVTTSLRFW